MPPPAAGATVTPVKPVVRPFPPAKSAFPAPTLRRGNVVPLYPLAFRWDSKGLSSLAAGGSSAFSARAPRPPEASFFM